MNKLKVSITSYPRRFKMLKRVLESLEKQTYTDFDVVITLYKQECENDLELLNKIISNSNLNIKINFVDTNTYCHKNTFEVMKLYPDNPILVIDDDVMREENCIKNFIDDYLENDCIIARTFDNLLKNNKIINKQQGIRYIPNKQMFFTGNEMPNTGGYGILYPPHCIKDKRFYDKDLILKCSPTSTEVWLFYWLCKEHTKLFFKWSKTFTFSLSFFQKEGKLGQINTVEQRNIYFKNCQDILGNLDSI